MTRLRSVLVLSLLILLFMTVFCAQASAGIKLPENLEEIQEEAFMNDKAIEEISLPDGLKRIGSKAFSGVSGVMIFFPNSIVYIASDAFDNGADIVAWGFGSDYVETYCIQHSIVYHTAVGKEGDFEYTVANNKATITKYTGSGGVVRIPDTLGGCPVAAIKESVFKGNTAISEVFLPQYLEQIAAYQFENCTSLLYVFNTGSPESIGVRAFAGCVNLKKINLNDGLKVIDGQSNYSLSGAFYGCASLTQIRIPNSVTRIGPYAFKGCTAMAKLVLESGDLYSLSIGIHAFENTGITGTLTIPSRVTVLDTSCFQNTQITGLVIMKGNLNAIATYAFYGNQKLELVSIPGNVEKIGALAFAQCTSLRTAGLSNGLKTIDGQSTYAYSGAFYGCTSLTKISIPSTVTSIGPYAFKECTAMQSLVFETGDLYSLSIGIHAFENTGITGTLTIPSRVTALDTSCFQNTQITGLVIMKGNLNAIATYAFYGNQKLELVSIPGNVEKIGALAFAQCTSLRTAGLSNGLKTIDGQSTYAYSGAFYGCTSLTKISIPSTVTSIGPYAFKECTAMQSLVFEAGDLYSLSIGIHAFENTGITGTLTIPSRVTALDTSCFQNTQITGLVIMEGNLNTIATYAFFGSKKLEIAAIPGNVEIISALAFAQCTSLGTVSLANGLKAIGGQQTYAYSGAFYGCTSLTGITIPSTVTNISAYAFKDCTAMSSLSFEWGNTYDLAIGIHAFENAGISGVLTIPARVTLLDEYCFKNTKISNLYITAGKLETIGYGAFEMNKNLFSISIPGNVERIGARAFAECESLYSVNLNEGLKTIGGQSTYTRGGAFYNCKSLRAISFPSTLTLIEEYAFKDCTSLESITWHSSVEIRKEAFQNVPGYP